MARIQDLVRELRRRRVFRAAGLYIVGAWVALQVASLVFPAINVHESAIGYVWLAAILLFPVALVFSWFFELSTGGIARTASPKSGDRIDLSLRGTDYLIIGALALVAVSITWQLTVQVRDIRDDPRVEFSARDIQPNSIAVLPLDNLSGDPEQQYFVMGMQDALISGLSRIRDLKVTSKTSTLRYAGVTEALPTIASQLRVAKLIEGSIFRVENRVRISVQLIDATEDRYIWSDTFEDEISDVLKLQSEVAAAIAEQVEVAVTSGESGRAEPGKVDPEAYEMFLKGQFHVERFTPQDMAAAKGYYEESLLLDPTSPLAHYGIAKLCVFQAQAGIIPPEVANDMCWPPIRKALELGEFYPEAHFLYAAYMIWQAFDWEEGGKGFVRAIELNPSYAEARIFYAHYLALMGRFDESIEQMRIALDLDPFNPFFQGLYGAQLMMLDEFQASVDVIEKAMRENPGFGFGYNVIWKAHDVLGNRDRAIESAANYLRLTQGIPAGAEALEEAYSSGDYDGALLAAASVLEKEAHRIHVPATSIGYLYESAGEVEKAIDWYEISFAQRDPDAPYMGVLVNNPAVQAHPRFIQLLREMKHDYWAGVYSAR